jgi:hypothetical protein
VIDDFAAWRDELIFTGNIVQDGETDVDPEEAESRSGDRYLELLEMVDGNEDDAVFQSIVDSMTATDDYEVYESSFRVRASLPATASRGRLSVRWNREQRPG